jgi:hypothetical protein
MKRNLFIYWVIYLVFIVTVNVFSSNEFELKTGIFKYKSIESDGGKDCTVPSGLNVQNEKINGADLYWSIVDGAISYDIEITDYNDNPTGVPTYDGVTTIPFTVTGLKHRSYYKFYVRAKCGESVYSDWSYWQKIETKDARTYLIEPEKEAVDVPLNVTLRWKKIDGATKYLLSLGTTLNGTEVLDEYSISDTFYVSPTGYEPCTDYYWKIKTVYNGTNDTAYYSISTGDRFATECQVLTPTYSQSFNNAFPPACWKSKQGILKTNTGFTNDYSKWYQDDFANDPNNELSAVVYGYLTDPNYSGQWLISPCIDLSGGDYNLEFDFAVTKHQSTEAINIYPNDTFAVVISVDGNWSKSNILRLWTNSSPVSNVGEHIKIDLSSYNDESSVQIGFYAKFFENTENNPNVDKRNYFVNNFIIRKPPPCPAPLFLTAYDITNHSAMLDWTETGNSTNWDIELGDEGFVPTGNSTASVTTHPYYYDGLSANKYFDFYVRSKCSEGNVSEWSGPETFLTACGINEIPYFEDFDKVSASTNELPPCMVVENVDDDVIRWVLTGTGAYSSPNKVVIKYFASDTIHPKNDWFYTPALNMDGNKTYKLSFYFEAGFYVDRKESFSVHLGTDTIHTAMSPDPLFIKENYHSAGYEKATVTFSPPSTGIYYIGFYAFTPNKIMGNLSIDNILIEEVEEEANYWTGEVNTDWNNSGNWTKGVPDQNSNIIIPAGLTNYPVINGNVNFKSIKLKDK